MTKVEIRSVSQSETTESSSPKAMVEIDIRELANMLERIESLDRQIYTLKKYWNGRLDKLSQAATKKPVGDSESA